jgi:hypothetical protein
MAAASLEKDDSTETSRGKMDTRSGPCA